MCVCISLASMVLCARLHSGVCERLAHTKHLEHRDVQIHAIQIHETKKDTGMKIHVGQFLTSDAPFLPSKTKLPLDCFPASSDSRGRGAAALLSEQHAVVLHGIKSETIHLSPLGPVPNQLLWEGSPDSSAVCAHTLKEKPNC